MASPRALGPFLVLVITLLCSCESTPNFNGGGTLLGAAPDSSTSGTEGTEPGGDADDDDASDTDGDEPGDNADSFEGVFGYATLVGTQRYPGGRYTVGYSYFVKPLLEGEENPEGELNGPRGQDTDEFGCASTTPETNGTSEGRGTEKEYLLLDAGDELEFIFAEGNEDSVWLLPWTDVGDGTGVYYAPPPQEGNSNGNPRALPPDERLDFHVYGGADVPAFEILGGLRTHPGFEVDRPSLPGDDSTLPVNPELGIQFLWPPMGEQRVYIEAVFTQQETGSQWRIECNVADEGAFDVEPEHFSEIPGGTRGRLSIRRFVDEYYPATEEHPELLLQGAFQNQWGIQLDGGGPGNGGGPGGGGGPGN
ncbi:MAG TPA: hypothetical protein DIU15_07795 [Deltaproteobacteria bacterium]|nr:hypothetical protein [Deltaproteobacteria bacterium]HCP45927.1 hypothetical protein [Deltaproteobacteria bacterium]